MRIIQIIVGLVGGLMMVYFMSGFFFGTFFDMLGFMATSTPYYGELDMVTTAVERFDLVGICGVGISIALVVWAILSAAREVEYSREY